ncbi:VOC family protein [Coralliovum pocilloporae]|uniref:VOC family protein n=1 Tax=Coralliovum pocilloporae TaxID=3066369 RepID=UPI003306DD40
MKTLPDGMSSVIPHLMFDGADEAIAFYEKTLDANLTGRVGMPGSDSVLHAMLQIGTSTVFVSDPMPGSERRPPQGLSPVEFYVYVEDVDAAFSKAMAGGMTSPDEGPMDMFWGDRTAVVHDPYGYVWTLAQHQRDVTPEEIEAAMATMMQQE